jgi:hypothetical protein
MTEAEVQIQQDGSNLWYEHPTYGQAVDVAALPLRTAPGTSPSILTVNQLRETTDMRIDVGQDVFILGFPLEPKLTESLPVWKRGTIASEPAYKVSGFPQLLIDTATRPGMSGSLVVARSFPGYISERGTQIISGGYHFRLIGVYSGRLGGNEDDKVQLGVVWRTSLIDEICAGAKPGEVRLS